MNNINKIIIDERNTQIPEVGLGEFSEGFVSQLTPFNFKWLWWLLLPIIGWVCVVVFILSWVVVWLNEMLVGKKQIVFLYKEGVLWRRVPRLFGKPSDIIFRYEDVGGIKNSKESSYQLIFGFRQYLGTQVKFDVCGINGTTLLRADFRYRNENNDPDKFIAENFATAAIQDAWNEISLERLNAELHSEGCCSFITVSGIHNVLVQIGGDFIKAGKNIAKHPFRYSLEGGYLHIWPDAKDANCKHFSINVNDMYDGDLFLHTATHLLGLKFT